MTITLESGAILKNVVKIETRILPYRIFVTFADGRTEDIGDDWPMLVESDALEGENERLKALAREQAEAIEVFIDELDPLCEPEAGCGKCNRLRPIVLKSKEYLK